MPDQPPPTEPKQSFFSTLPGILTGVAALLTAIATVAGVFIWSCSGTEMLPVGRPACTRPNCPFGHDENVRLGPTQGTR